MSEKRDEEMIEKGAVKRILKRIERQDHATIQALFIGLQKAIDRLPVESSRGNSWVLKKLKEKMKKIIEEVGVGRPPLYSPHNILELLNDLESQIPAESV